MGVDFEREFGVLDVYEGSILVKNGEEVGAGRGRLKLSRDVGLVKF